MIIKINTDKTISGEKRNEDYFTSIIEKSLKRFDSHITRIEVHLKDENGKKEGIEDISCVLEARLEGRQPIAVSSKADSPNLAIKGAVDKLKNALETIIGRIQDK